MAQIIRWSEPELVDEIAGLRAVLSAQGDTAEPASRCARAYLRQLLHDREENLRLLEFRRRHGQRASDGARESNVRPLLRG